MHRRLLSLWVTGALLLPLCWGTESENDDEYYDYEATPTPDYDYNSTFDYFYYNNSSSVNYELYEILKGREEEEIRGHANKASGTVLAYPAVLLGLTVHHICHLL